MTASPSERASRPRCGAYCGHVPGISTGRRQRESGAWRRADGPSYARPWPMASRANQMSPAPPHYLGHPPYRGRPSAGWRPASGHTLRAGIACANTGKEGRLQRGAPPADSRQGAKRSRTLVSAPTATRREPCCSLYWPRAPHPCAPPPTEPLAGAVELPGARAILEPGDVHHVATAVRVYGLAVAVLEPDGSAVHAAGTLLRVFQESTREPVLNLWRPAIIAEARAATRRLGGRD